MSTPAKSQGTFADSVETNTRPIREAILNSPFITGIGDGSLDVEKFKYYVRQDYVYLMEYSRVLALASARATDLESMSWFARLLHETLNTEMALHRSYCAQFSITTEELEATKAAPATLAYTRFLLTLAHQASYAELVASLLPCQWGYWEVGDHLARRGEPNEAPLYFQWIQMYSSPEFKALADWIRSLANRLAQEAGPTELARMEDAYLTSLRYEYLFWEMSYNLESWPV